MNSQNQEQPQQQNQEQKPNDKELNFRALEAKYERKLAEERALREEAQKVAQDALSKQNSIQDEDTYDEPYVDHKRLNKTLSSFEKKMEEKIEKKAEEKARILVEQTNRENWLRQNPDFFDTLKYADKFAEKEPELAETILQMPEGFERQKLVYKNIKALGLHKPEIKQPSIQEKIDANKRSPYYQPSGMGAAPYAPTGDYSDAGKKSAYDKMQELKQKMRL